MRKRLEPNANTSTAIGSAAEAAAEAHLCRQGLHPIARNVRYRFGEIDLILREGKTLVFVEVRQRRDNAFGGAAASIDRRKCGRIAKAASAWLASQPSLAQAPCRFDVVALSGAQGITELVWIRNAFTLDDLHA